MVGRKIEKRDVANMALNDHFNRYRLRMITVVAPVHPVCMGRIILGPAAPRCVNGTMTHDKAEE